ncbi:M48 family metalloprotease, partial [Candidatus Aerophobetes bacterium]|nr:M48 family metalloprotease [Candidatus Aerophobetes bacterium]
DRQNLEYHFKILDDPMVNAFACPGGFIYVTTGILKTMESEAELAGILGHEVGHVTARHAVKRIQGMLAYTILASLLLKDEDARQIIDVVFNLILLGYSREDEFQADRLGARYAYEANYDPRGLRDFLAKLKKLEQRKPLAIETLISSHPPTSQRIKKIEH